MSVTTHDYVRKSFPVEAIQVTEENMKDVAEWCNGSVMRASVQKDGEASRPRNFIRMNINGARNSRQTTAFAGDWILKSAESFKIYTDKAFKGTFTDPYKDQDLVSIVEQKVLTAMKAQDVATYYGEGSDGPLLVASQTAKEIVQIIAA